MSAVFFRAGVGACVFNARGQVLALKRKGVPENSWQMPQGGIEDGEDARAALWRELEEETGLLRRQVEIVAECPGWLAYELPVNYRNAKVGWGQVQKWFLLRAPDAVTITPDGKEFEDWAWSTPAAMLPLVAEFRRPVYERVFELLARRISPPGTPSAAAGDRT